MLDVIWVPEFARAGWLLDLTPHLEPGELAPYFPSTVEAATYDGRIWALPWNMNVGLQRFLVWSLAAIPLVTVILVSVASGIVLVGVPLWFERWRLRARVRSLESRLGAAEAPRGERDRAAGSSPPAP